MSPAAELFEAAISWLRTNYWADPFHYERDIVWTLQKYLTKEIAKRQLSYRVFSEYPMLPGPRRAISADLVIIDPVRGVDTAAEFKYEPSHARDNRRGGDILGSRFDVVAWSDVGKDIQRIQEFVALRKAHIAYTMLIDEGSYWRRLRPQPPPGSTWIDWGNCGNPGHQVSVLWSKVSSENQSATGQ